MRVLACLLLLLPAALPAQDHEGTYYALSMSYDRPGLTVPHWEIAIPGHGMATYSGKPDKGVDPGAVSFRMSPAGRQKLGQLLGKSHDLQPCETGAKGIANMGQKEVRYAPAGGVELHCKFNYTDNKPLGEAVDYMMGTSATIQAGLEIERLHRYDRLGLDQAVGRLVDQAKDGHAVELGSIRPTLESLVTDVALMDRVRNRAQQLLDLANLDEKPAP